MELGGQTVHRITGGAEHQRARGGVIAQHIDDGVLAVMAGHGVRQIGDVGVLVRRAQGRDAQRVALIGLGDARDLFGHGGRE